MMIPQLMEPTKSLNKLPIVVYSARRKMDRLNMQRRTEMVLAIGP